MGAANLGLAGGWPINTPGPDFHRNPPRMDGAMVRKVFLPQAFTFRTPNPGLSEFCCHGARMECSTLFHPPGRSGVRRAISPCHSQKRGTGISSERLQSILLSPLSFLRDSAAVTWQDLSPDWQMTWLNLVALASMGLAMKAIVLLLPRAKAARTLRFICSPVLAPNSLERSQPLSAAPAFFRRAGGCLIALIIYYAIYGQLVRAFHLQGLVLHYLAVPAVLLMTEVFTALVTLLWLPSGRLLPRLHRNPFAARSVAEFWGRRWNLWISDWFRYVIFQPLRRRPGRALWLAFSVSGLLHEYVLNLALWFVTGHKLFGTMMIYFFLQPIGMQMERRFLKNHPRGNVLFTWLVVLVPVPLVFNESMLRLLHLWPQ